MGDDQTPPDRPGQRHLTVSEIRHLAGAGLAAVGIRQLAIRAIAFGGTVVLARLLLPRDFGAVAIGTTLVTLFSLAADAGVGAGLIRGARAPERQDLQSFLGLQLLVTSILTIGAVAVGWEHGVVGRVTILMVAALPIAAFRTPGAIVLERDLHYRPLVVIELVETLTFYVWAILAVMVGWGVWGLASAAPVRAVVGALLLTIWSPVGFLTPRLSWRRLRPLLRFGLQYQTYNAVALARDQGLNLGVAAVSGVAVLGLWSLAYRIMQVPFLLFDAVWRVSFPAMARLIAAGEEPRPIMERGLALASLVTGGLLSALVGSTPALVPAVFGQPWSTAASVLPWASLGLMIGGPVSVATSGYLYAIGDSGSVLVSGVVQAVVWWVVAFSLLPIVGFQALGIGWLTASVLESIVLTTRTRRHTPIHVVRHIALPAAIGLVSAAAGWLVASRLGPNIPSAMAGMGVATAMYCMAIALMQRRLLEEAVTLGRRSLSSLAG